MAAFGYALNRIDNRPAGIRLEHHRRHAMRNRAAAILCCLWGLGSWCQAGQSFSSPFVDVVVLDVPLGAPRAIQDKEGHGLLLQNSSDQALAVHVEIMVPQANQLRGNASPIPNPAWITVEPADVFLPAHESVTCEIHVLVPRDKKYRNRFYQAMVWSRARPAKQQGVSVSVGLLSRLRIKTASQL